MWAERQLTNCGCQRREVPPPLFGAVANMPKQESQLSEPGYYLLTTTTTTTTVALWRLERATSCSAALLAVFAFFVLILYLLFSLHISIARRSWILSAQTCSQRKTTLRDRSRLSCLAEGALSQPFALTHQLKTQPLHLFLAKALPPLPPCLLPPPNPTILFPFPIGLGPKGT